MKKNHGQFIVTLIDQANVNVAFICKWFYVVVFLKEVGISRNEETKCTEKYKYSVIIDAEIINKHS